MKVSRSKIFSGVLIIWMAALIIYYFMPVLEAKLLAAKLLLFDYITWQTKAADEPLWRVLWAIGDLSEGTVHKAIFASVGLAAGGIIAHVLWKKKSKWAGFPVCANLGVFPWVLLAAFIGLFVSSALYGGFLKDGWMPTFLPGCTIPAALVFMYGGNWRVAVTGGIICGVLQFPCGWVGATAAAKLGIPGICVFTITAMAIAGIVIMELVKRLPWIKNILPQPGEEKGEKESNEAAEEKLPALPPGVGTGPVWVIRRTFADFTEIYFFGNEIAGIGLVLGLIVSWLLNPAHTGYGGPGFTSAILASQLMAVSLAIFVYYHKYTSRGWFCTFTASLASGNMVMFFGPTMDVVIIGALLAAFITPLFSGFLMDKLSSRPWHPIIGITGAMGVAITLETFIMKGILTII